MEPVRVTSDRLAAANAIYEEIAFAPSGAADDLWAIGDLRALGRIVHHGDGALELGGVWVHPDERGRGLAHVLVSHLVRRLEGRACWCLPFVKLDAFYRGYGFLPTDVPPPDSIVRRLRRCGDLYVEEAVVRLRP